MTKSFPFFKYYSVDFKITLGLASLKINYRAVPSIFTRQRDGSTDGDTTCFFSMHYGKHELGLERGENSKLTGQNLELMEYSRHSLVIIIFRNDITEDF